MQQNQRLAVTLFDVMEPEAQRRLSLFPVSGSRFKTRREP